MKNNANNQFRINIYNEVNGVAAVSSIDGKNIYEKIKAAINSNKNVVLDFLNIEFVTSAFFNTAIGQLFNDFSDEKINSILLEHISANDLSLYNQVIDRAREYYRNPDYRAKLIDALKGEISGNENN